MSESDQDVESRRAQSDEGGGRAFTLMHGKGGSHGRISAPARLTGLACQLCGRR